MAPPTYRKYLRDFIGVIKYYRNMCSRRSNTLLPFTKLTSIKRKFKWSQVKQDAFNKIKRIVTRDTLLTYPDLIKQVRFIPMPAHSN